ncbi:hypothetical protein STSP2_01111 [Anaerohalosphaera lusitana]|uniref:Uncharacterized protein n=1 Tax=Anaerohalosphaera lusitana TaxID=1936003 RepID=A0A1U9NJ55_9BACT|nr:hypothetical protein [Anaerohalosphaera lusitana]AQT67959.1 hypothetical protein STSP2_01111 [Anaerohalosphaera lusitana]
MSKRIIYYTDNSIDDTRLAKVARKYIRRSSIAVTSVTHKPMEFGDNFVFYNPPSARSILRQVLMGLYTTPEKTVYLCEHDCLYHRSHFALETDGVAFNTNVYRLTNRGFYKKSEWVLSQLIADRDCLIQAIEQKLAQPDPIKLLEPGRGDNWPVELLQSKLPNVDVRHGRNFSHWRPRGKRRCRIPHWGHYAGQVANVL